MHIYYRSISNVFRYIPSSTYRATGADRNVRPFNNKRSQSQILSTDFPTQIWHSDLGWLIATISRKKYVKNYILVVLLRNTTTSITNYNNNIYYDEDDYYIFNIHTIFFSSSVSLPFFLA